MPGSEIPESFARRYVAPSVSAGLPVDGMLCQAVLVEGDADPRCVAQHDPAVLEPMIRIEDGFSAGVDDLHHQVVRQDRGDMGGVSARGS